MARDINDYARQVGKLKAIVEQLMEQAEDIQTHIPQAERTPSLSPEHFALRRVIRLAETAEGVMKEEHL